MYVSYSKKLMGEKFDKFVKVFTNIHDEAHDHACGMHQNVCMKNVLAFK